MDESNIVANYNKIDEQRGTGNLDYCLHELAHFVVLFRKPPRIRKADSLDMNMCLETMTCARAQLHELRVIKLQHEVLKIPMKQLLESVWGGIRDAGYSPLGKQRDVVTSRTKALRMTRAIVVSPRLMRAYRQAITRFSKCQRPAIEA